MPGYIDDSMLMCVIYETLSISKVIDFTTLHQR